MNIISSVEEVDMIGKFLKEIRLERGHTQLELALYLDVSEKTISSWEVDRTEPSLDYLVKISEFLNCSVDNLVGKSGISSSENHMVSQYRNLDDYGRKVVSAVLKLEHDRCKCDF